MNVYQKFKTCTKLPNYPGPCTSTTRANSFGLAVVRFFVIIARPCPNDDCSLPWWAWLLIAVGFCCMFLAWCAVCIGAVLTSKPESSSFDRDERPLLPMASVAQPRMVTSTMTPQTGTHYQTGNQFSTVPQTYATQTFAPQRPTFTTNPTPY